MLPPTDHFEEINKKLKPFYSGNNAEFLSYVNLNDCQFPGEGKTHSRNVLYSSGIILILYHILIRQQILKLSEQNFTRPD